jgi:hypothetical protein
MRYFPEELFGIVIPSIPRRSHRFVFGAGRCEQRGGEPGEGYEAQYAGENPRSIDVK